MIVYQKESYEIEILPLENGKGEYKITLHDFENKNGFCGKVDYTTLERLIKQGPSLFLRTFTTK